MAEVESLSDGSEDSSMEVETTWKPMADVLLEFNGLQKLGRLFQAEGEDVIGPKYRFLRYEATVFDQQQHIKPHSLATLSWLKRGTFVYFDTFDDFEILLPPFCPGLILVSELEGEFDTGKVE